MARSLVADTHAVVWYFSNSPRLSQKAAAALDETLIAGEPLYVSTISVIELIYLMERKRLPQNSLNRLLQAAHDPDSSLMLAPVDTAVALAVERIDRDQVPDMPDRIIAATAMALGAPLITADSKIRADTTIETIW